MRVLPGVVATPSGRDSGKRFETRRRQLTKGGRVRKDGQLYPRLELRPEFERGPP
jgi:hypothetical protein